VVEIRAVPIIHFKTMILEAQKNVSDDGELRHARPKTTAGKLEADGRQSGW
jgi:hypothetical protein